MDKKDTNPKDALGIRKAGLQCVPGSIIIAIANAFGGIANIPCRVLFELGMAMSEGARKYGRHNYRVTGVRASVYYDAFMRHLSAGWWHSREDIDPDSGVCHIIKALACLTVVYDSRCMLNWIDDRPPCLPSFSPIGSTRPYGTASFFYEECMNNFICWWEGGNDKYFIDTVTMLINLRNAIHTGELEDDRPTDGKVFLPELNETASGLISKYPNCVDPYTQWALERQ